ncbi:MAG TPA: assimilatory sulfite reductase (NADPH) flavoprotein subunit [Steroidobacteraceae bacterium]|nr:assimilatory sulfite reductase (NADPH) flavoprotein subunit [Steroidobacteraceae bacterium]
MSGNARASSAPTQGSQPADPWAAAPMAPSLAAEVRALVSRLDRDQRLWLSGFLAGLESQTQPAPAPVSVPETGRPAVTVLFGSQTGNSERLAKQIADRLTERGVRFALLDMLQCNKSHLQDAQHLLLIVSTHGDGDPPERAVPLSELLAGRRAPRLEHVRYAVLALGDSSYEKYCEAGRQFDARLEALGAQRLHPREECDVDFEAPAARWIDAVVGKLEQSLGTTQPRLHVDPADRRTASVSNAYTRKNPFAAAVLANQHLTATGSTKDVRHIELALEGSNMHYEPGDSIGIVPRNCEQDVDALLERLPFAAESPVPADAHTTVPLRQALIERFEIGPVTRPFLKRYAEAIRSSELAMVAAASDEEISRFMRGRHVADVVAAHAPGGLEAHAFARLLPPLAPRLYSIASSQRSTPDEVHLTVSIVQYESFGRARRGVVSGTLADLTSEDAVLPIYLHRNPAFRLPADPQTPIVMIGPGTGVAPFRAFLAERAEAGAAGRNWLFFGDRSFEHDFLYQAEWLELRKRGLLTRMDVAFSRDQSSKVYVQHRMLEQGAELWRWIEDGAYVYVCGDAQHMAPDVHEALLKVVAEHGGLDEEGAAEHILGLQQQRRYQRDVY